MVGVVGHILIGVWLLLLTVGVVVTMANELDLEGDFDALEAVVVEIAAEIAALKAQGAPLVTQAQLDSLDSRAKAAVAALKAAE